MDRDNDGLGSLSEVEGRQHDMDRAQGYERIISRSVGGVRSPSSHGRGTSLCLIGTSYTKEEKPDHWQSQSQILGLH